MSKKVYKLILVSLILAVLLSGCTLPWKKKSAPAADAGNNTEAPAEEAVARTLQPKKFSDYEGLKSFLAENRDAIASDPAAETGKAAEISFVHSGGSLNDNQAGANTPDIIKVDGTHAYALVRNELKIMKVEPAAESSVVSTVSFSSRPEGLLVSGAYLAVFGVDQQMSAQVADKDSKRHNPYIFLKVYDLNDPASPKLVRDLDFEGYFNDIRLAGDHVYLFTDSYGSYSEGETPLPRVLDGGAVLPSSCDSSGKCFAPEIFYFDIAYRSFHFSNISVINIKDSSEAISGQSYLFDSGQNIYVSAGNIYMTYTDRLDEESLEREVKKELTASDLSSEDRDKINKIEAAESYILDSSEKQAKAAAIVDGYIAGLSSEDQLALQSDIDEGLRQKLSDRTDEIEKTAVYKIGINGRSLEYRGMSEINGQVFDRFSMDEEGGYLRIATSRSQLWSRLAGSPEKYFSNVYVLDSELKTIGSLENIVTNEKISFMRFFGDRAYAVSYKQSDPLYIISLSDSAKPSIAGAIKIPGYAPYLYPADKNGSKLIGLGRNAGTDGGTNGGAIKITLFDFSDLGQPKELDSYLIGDNTSDSIALQDHKAFSYFETGNILSVPAVLRDSGRISFAGAVVFGLADNRLVLKGKVDHSGGSGSSEADQWGGYNYYDNTVKRSLYVNGSLCTFSNKFWKANNFNNLDSTASLILTAGKDDNITAAAGEAGQASSPAASGLPISGETPVSNEIPADSATAVDTGSQAGAGTSSQPVEPVTMVNGEVVSSPVNP